MTDAPLVRLRDLTLADADIVDAWHNDPERSGFNDFGEPPSPLPRDVLAQGPLRNEHNGMLMVETLDGRPIGTVGWHRVHYGPGDRSNAWNFGIELRPDERGRGYGTAAQRELARYLFATTDANRVEASTDVENIAEQRALEKAGYVREGIQRGSQFRAGAYHDLVTYARLRDDPD
ncbi:MAG TPA: GNAT family protein [Candidatus Limnocylindria bacterium]|nr:GNAT family protein [Candidatus Limnocylindria bacterium]